MTSRQTWRNTSKLYQWNPKRLEDSKEACDIVLSLTSSFHQPLFPESLKFLVFAFWYVGIVHQSTWLRNRSYKIKGAENKAFAFSVLALGDLSEFNPSEKLNSKIAFLNLLTKGGKANCLQKLSIGFVVWTRLTWITFRVLSRKVTAFGFCSTQELMRTSLTGLEILRLLFWQRENWSLLISIASRFCWMLGRISI